MQIVVTSGEHRRSLPGTDAILNVHVKHSVSSRIWSSTIAMSKATLVGLCAWLGVGGIGSWTVVSTNWKSLSYRRKWKICEAIWSGTAYVYMLVNVTKWKQILEWLHVKNLIYKSLRFLVCSCIASLLHIILTSCTVFLTGDCGIH